MTDSGPELVKGFADECDKLWVWRGGDALRAPTRGQMAKRGHASPLQDQGSTRNEVEKGDRSAGKGLVSA